MLPELLRELCKIDSNFYIRVLYCYPDRMTDELIDTIASEPKVLKYIDLPLQHASGKLLKRMNRHGDREVLTELINKLRTKIPNLTIRTTFITGFPGETEEDFTELSEFVRDMRFDRMGCLRIHLRRILQRQNSQTRLMMRSRSTAEILLWNSRQRLWLKNVNL